MRSVCRIKVNGEEMDGGCVLLFLLSSVAFSVNCAVHENGTTVAISENRTIVIVSDNDTIVAIPGNRESVSVPVHNGTAVTVPESTTVLSNDVPAVDLVAVPEQTFREAEKEIVDFINSLLRSLLPKIVGGSGASGLSPRCTSGMMKIFGNVRRLNGWTLKMLDSMGKVAPGILKGTSYTMGNYDECLDLSISNRGQETTDTSQELFRGKYCKIKVQFRKIIIDTAREYQKGSINATDLGKLKDVIQIIPYIPVELQYMSHFIGLCFPSVCTDDDINHLAKLLPFPGSASVDRCEIRTDTEVDTTQLIVICIFLFLIILATVSTCVDWLTYSRTDTHSVDGHDKRCVSVSISFSICNNTKRLLKNVEEDVDGLLSGKVIRGMVVASVAWVIAGQTYFFPFEAFYTQTTNLGNLRSYWDESYFVILQGFPLAIDALFVCYGFVLTYSLWYSTSKSQKIGVNVIMLLINDYIRLCIPLFFYLGLVVLLPLLGSGPQWKDMMESSIERCKNSAWSYIGMYGNFLDLKDQCFPHLWFVPCLSQLTFVGIILSWILSKRLKCGIFITMLLCIGCSTVVGVVTHKNNLPPSYVPYFADETSNLFWKISMALPLSHFGPFAVGMLTGILVARRENHISRMCVGGIGWIVCAGLLYVIFSTLFQGRDNSLGTYWTAVYAGLHRTVFGVCMAWVMIASSFSVGGFVNAILSWKIFDPLYKLSYYAYIFHVIIISYVVGTSRTQFSYSHLELVIRATFYIAASYAIAYFFFMLLEMPLKSFRAVLCPSKSRQIEVTPLNNFKIPPVDIVSKNTIEGSCKLWSITETPNGELK